MTWKLFFEKDAQKDLDKLPIMVQKRLWSFLTERILPQENPRISGEALKGPLKEFWRYRVGDYRIVCSIDNDTVTIIVVAVGHRSTIYKTMS